MRFKGTIIWTLVLMTLAAFVYIYEIKGGAKREQTAEMAKKVLIFDKEDVQQLVLKRPEEIISFQRAQDGWQIIHPVRARADESAIQGIIDNLERAQIERVVAETADNLSDFGLQSPQVTVELEYAGGLRESLRLGDRNPTRSFVYSQRDPEERIFLTQVALLTQAQKDLFDLRDRRVLFFEDSQVNELELQRGGEITKVRRSPEGWTMEKPFQTRGDDSSIEALLRRLKGARVESFVEEQPGSLTEYGLHKPALTITLTLGADAAQKKLLIGKEKEEQRYAQDQSRSPVFLIPSNLVQDLDKSAFELRNKQVLQFDRDEVDRLELRSLDQTIICTKDTSGQWQMVAPESSAAKTWKVESILSSLSSIKAESFVEEDPRDLARYGLSKPRFEAILKSQGSDLAALRIGKDEREQVYACDETGAPIALVAERIVATLSPELKDLVELEAPVE
ncbi:MAG: hypothetical protein AMJ92_02035 [candidate division Zixibacteria bacterium SM23_81]|nr:MAG: hypothetical protein AMJ92_02035 [candidate division Zixibacteria bacterium SM23_81]